MRVGAPPAVAVYRGSGVANSIRQRSLGTCVAALNCGPRNRLTSHTDTALAAPSPASITALYDGASRRVKQVANYSVCGATDALISDRRSRRRQDRLYPRLGYDAGAHRCQRGDQVSESHRNLSPVGGLGFPRPAAGFGGSFSGEDAPLRQGRALPEGLAADCEQAEAGVSALR